jgi:hypothetical protein
MHSSSPPFVGICANMYFFLFHYRQHDIHSEICTSAEGMAFLLLFLQSEGSSNCSGMVWNGKSIQTEILEVKRKCVSTEI